MRILIAIILFAAAGWSAYWFYGSRALDAAIRDGIEAMRAKDIAVETEDISVTGFPNRFDTMIDEPRISWPSGIGWSAPFLQVFSLSYRPNQIIAALPPTQTVTGAFGTATIETERTRASALFLTDAALTLDHANLVANGVRATIGDRTLTADSVIAATRIPEGATADRQNIGITLDNVDLPRALVARLGGADAARIDGATLDATLDLTGPVTVRASETDRLEITRMEIARLDLDWGGMTLGATGVLDVAEDGSLSGSLDLSLTNWRRALEIAEVAGFLPPGQGEMLARGIAAMAALTGRDDRLEAPLAFRGGRIWLGPMPVGPAPRF